MSTVLDSTRHEWQEGYLRLQAASGDRLLQRRLQREIEIVLEGLRRRVGQTFTLDELAAAYAESDRWAQAALAERDPAPGWPTRLTTVQEAAFHIYSRGAADYRP
jgi:hypothetical protein